MQQCTVLAGFYGDELLNAIYMPRGSVAIQLLPFTHEHLNPNKYSDILKSNGHYLEWTNPIEEPPGPSEGVHAIVGQGTIVAAGDFVALVKNALKLGINRNHVFRST